MPNGELLVDIDKPYCVWGDKDYYEHLADVSSEHFAEIVRDSNDMLESMISAQRERGEGKCDSLGSFLDWLTIGIVSGIWESIRERHIAMVKDPSFLNILNALTIGASDTVVGAIAPDEPWSFEHFLDIIGTVLIAFSAYKAVKKLSRIGPAAGMLDDVLPDGSYRKITTETAEDVNAEFAKANYAPPYKLGTKTVVIELMQTTTFVRVYNKTNSCQIGGWIMKYEDIEGLTPEQI